MGIVKKIIKYGKLSRIYFENLANEWIQSKKNLIKESTYYNYMYIIDKYLMPELKKMNLRKLLSYNYSEYIDKLSETLSNKSVRDATNVLKAILKYAESEYNCKVDLKTLIPPKLQIENLKVLSKKEKKKIEKYCLAENSLRSIGIIVCLNTGLRIGEICALKWEDIDLDQKLIYVRKTLQRIYKEDENNTKVVINAPKTQKSVRTIPITNKLFQILQPMKKQYKKEDFFLSGDSEKYIEPRNYQYMYKIILKRSKIKTYKFHILRHTFATDCIEVGMDPKSLSEILGHADVNITLSRYVHSSYKIKKKFLEKL